MNESHKFAVIAALLALLIASSSVVVTVALHNRENVNGERISEGEYQLCERLNTVRHQSNNAHWVQWLQLKQSVVRSRVLAKTELIARRTIRLKGAIESEELATRLTWTRLTNCMGAVYHPRTYKAPSPSKFSEANLKTVPSDIPFPSQS